MLGVVGELHLGALAAGIDDVDRKHPQPGVTFRSSQENRGMPLRVTGAREPRQRGEHRAVVEVVAEHQGVAGAQQAIIRALPVQVGHAVVVPAAVRVVAEVVVGVALMGLDDRVVDAGARHGNPSDDVRVDALPVAPVDAPGAVAFAGRLVFGADCRDPVRIGVEVGRPLDQPGHG